MSDQGTNLREVAPLHSDSVATRRNGTARLVNNSNAQFTRQHTLHATSALLRSRPSENAGETGEPPEYAPYP